jgi:hypothetical protein
VARSSPRKGSNAGGKSRKLPSRRGVRIAASAATAESLPDLFDEDSPRHDDPAPYRSHATVPKPLVKFIVALFLSPLAWVLTETFFQTLASSVRAGLLANRSFGCFAGGILLFGVLFLLIPRNALMLPYVLGHEVTHALWVKIFGGRVADRFHVSLEGGHVMTDRVNTWIVLAPYFFPIYSVLVVTLYGAVKLAARLIGNPVLSDTIDSSLWLLFLLLGLTLAFHLVFTCILITKGQPDLHYGGTFFSLMVIYLINLLIITALVLATSRREISIGYGEGLVRNSSDFIELCGRAAAWLSIWIQDLRTGLGY